MAFLLVLFIIVLFFAIALGVDYLVMLGINFLLAGTPYHVSFLQVVVGLLILGVIGSIVRGPSRTPQSA